MAWASSSDRLVVKMLAAGENAAEQYRGIDRRNLRVPHPFAGVDVGKVKEESAMCGQLVPQKRQALDYPQARLGMADEAALLSDANGRQAETGGCDTGGECWYPWRARCSDP